MEYFDSAACTAAVVYSGLAACLGLVLAGALAYSYLAHSAAAAFLTVGHVGRSACFVSL